MSVEHLPRSNTVPIPIDVQLFDGITPITGQAGNMTLRIVCLDNGFTLDNADGVFRTSPATPTQSMAALTDYAYDYKAMVYQNNWPRGTYRGIVRNTSSGREWAYDFTIGLFVPRQLGYSAVYDGTNLNLSVWVEELGVTQTDFTALNSPRILNCTGGVLSDGTLSNNTTRTDGVFNFQVPVALAPNSNYLFKCDAVVPGPSGRPDLTYNLRVGLARP